VQRTLGLMRTQLQVAEWALEGALSELGDDPKPSYDGFLAVMAAKAEIDRVGVEVFDLAMQVAGGAAYFKGSIIERCYRDIRAAAFHPLTPEATFIAAGRNALGLSQS
jgi:alkylation response protein AidB-like acyl-CoA dehydrogenase